MDISVIRKISFAAKAGLLLIFTLGFPSIFGQRLSRDLCVDIITNHLGYLPRGAKQCLINGTEERVFQVINARTQEAVFTGRFIPGKGDFGNFLTGDFSALFAEGTYYIKSDTLRSWPFRISENVYEPAMDAILNYFAKQRCGPSETGYLSPCHLDDGVRLDNGKHKDVTGGWHDASDLRKWVSATIYGMTGLAKNYELTGNKFGNRIHEELKWGNQYFLKMQEPEGYIMDFVGGDLIRNLDNNRWTDNAAGKDGGEAKLVRPNAGASTSFMLTMGDKDDRVIQTRPADISTQFRFAAAEAEMYRLTLNTDSAYAFLCLNASEKCFNWCCGAMNDSVISPEIYGAAIQAAVELYKATQNKKYEEFATLQAAELKKLQADDNAAGVSGFFFSSKTDKTPHRQILGSSEFIALCDLTAAFPDHNDAATWKEMIRRYIYNYLLLIAEKNLFGLIPYGLYAGGDPGGNRKAGNYFYRYFMQPELDWQVGINANIASAATGFVKAASILNDKNLLRAAQRELDWICGCNPLNSSTIVGFGNNQPPRYIPSAFIPHTPEIAGAVMNGLAGDHFDRPFIGDGIWQVSEYWTPMVAATFRLMAELRSALE
jgi:hypothetical protein